MSYRIMVYGATGYSGRLIAAEGARAQMTDGDGAQAFRMILAGRNGRDVANLARTLRMQHRVFALGERDEVMRGLTGIDVLINAAGPFALTANHLARAALAAGCHYVDINGESEVYMMLDDLHRYGRERKRALVSAAGHTAAASDMMLHAALRYLTDDQPGRQHVAEPLTVRMAVSRLTSLSRGSLETVSRSLREQVRVVRMGEVVDEDGTARLAPVLWHEPVGKLEHKFDFDHYDRGAADAKKVTPGRRDFRMATAANLVDTLTARLTVNRHRYAVRGIESYAEAGTVSRLTYQVASALAPLAAMPWVRDLVRLQAAALPVGPTALERKDERQVVVLEVDDGFYNRVIDWQWHTPNPYDFTAQVVVAIASRVAAGGWSGWLTPSVVLDATREDLTARSGYLRGCRLHEARSAPGGA